MCISNHFSKKKFPVGLTKLHKILYKTKISLPENNPIKDCLPFFWYIHGPFSSHIDAIKNKMINEEKISENSDGLTATANRIIEHDDNIKLARTIMNDIIDETSSINSQTIMDDVYSSDAPCEFYISFKTKFPAYLNNFLKNPNPQFTSDDVVNILENTMGDLPNNSLFRPFKYSLRDFIELFSLIMQSKPSSESLDEFKKLNDQIFLTFAKGIRIENHDKFYDSNVEQWKSDFVASISNLEQKIINFSKEFKQNLPISPFVSFDELIKNILDLRSKNALIMTSFLPANDDEKFNHGRIDEELFKDKNDEQFKELLFNFKNSRNAVVHSLKKNELETVNYKLITS